MHSTSSMLRPPSISSSGLGLSPPSLSSIASKSSTWRRKNCNDHKTASKSFFSQVHLVNALSFQLFLPIPIHKLIHTTYPLLTSIAEPANDLLRYFGTKTVHPDLISSGLVLNCSPDRSNPLPRPNVAGLKTPPVPPSVTPLKGVKIEQKDYSGRHSTFHQTWHWETERGRGRYPELVQCCFFHFL